MLLSSCAKPAQDRYGISEEGFVTLYSQVLIARQECALRGLDSLAVRHITDSLYGAYHLTREQASDILDGYKSDLENWKKFHVKVIKRLESMQEKIAIPLPDSAGRKRL
jgi:hypothetical protein